MVVSGAPNRDPNHAEKICDMAMDMVDASRGIKDPSGGIHPITLFTHSPYEFPNFLVQKRTISISAWGYIRVMSWLES